MLLLNTTTLRLEEIQDPSVVKYAILSHTWGDDEVSFKDMKDFATAKRQAGFVKIAKTCEIALELGLKYAWVDTCCINKASSAELSEAINSMFSWYRHSAVCFVWLEDLAPVYQVTELIQSTKAPPQNHGKELHDISKMGSCKWFSRGWTLQELLAPSEINFYDADWGFRFTKKDTISDLSRITRIDEDVLMGRKQLNSVLVGIKMSWAADRETTRPEDMAYCLMGIFDINMPMIYGEGKKAFERLQEHILSSKDDTSLFAWQSYDSPSQIYRGVFARSPKEFRFCADIRLGTRFKAWDPRFSLTNRGFGFSGRLIYQQ
ncbi:hypothetical protein K456DRAFT_1775001 [Colletotrichum gloeosporioides 23]|nr:hypothetical protein K456DRAFT_1775001 [Colletotrichum gloeosporioides 23]